MKMVWEGMGNPSLRALILSGWDDAATYGRQVRTAATLGDENFLCDRRVMADLMPRDLLGYGAHRPDPHWPDGARLAVDFVLNYEEGAEYSVPDGDAGPEQGLGEGSIGVPPGMRDLNAESVYEFGSRVGFWRLSGCSTRRGCR
jgi:hypothetical protein